MPTTNNTAYNVRTDVVTSESGLTIEEGALYTYDGELKAHLGGTTVVVKPKTEVVNISSAQIKDWVANPISILPSIGANEYYDIQKAVLEYKHNGTNYTYTNPTIYLSNTGLAPVSKSAFNWGADNIQVLTPSVTSTIDAQPYDKSTGVTLTSNEDLLTGNGTLRVIITYTIRTFGA